MAAEAAQSGVELPAAVGCAMGNSAESVLAPAPLLVPSAAAPSPVIELSADVGGVVQPACGDPARPPPSAPLPTAAVLVGASPPAPAQASQPPVQAAVAGSAQATAVGAGSDPVRLASPESAPPPQAAPPSVRLGQQAGSANHANARGNATSHRGRGSLRHRPSPSYRSAHRGGRGGWRGGPGRGLDSAAEVQQLHADLPWMFAAAMHSAQMGSSNPMGSQAPMAAASVPAPVVERAPAAPPAALPAFAPAFKRMAVHPYPVLPWVPPVVGMEFVGAGGGAGRAPFVPSRRIADFAPADPAPRCNLAEGTFPRQLAALVVPLLAAPARGGAAVGQMDEAVRVLRGHLRAGHGAEVIGASIMVLRPLWRTLTGILAALKADQM
ncbi:unnamed protein product [Closterium sp. Naga37s-1]|nr:unnamed protein product [Closterium sp. Naga37s-1]